MSFAGLEGTTSAYVRKGDRSANLAIFCTFSLPTAAYFLVTLDSAMLLINSKSRWRFRPYEQIRELFEADLVCFAYHFYHFLALLIRYWATDVLCYSHDVKQVNVS